MAPRRHRRHRRRGVTFATVVFGAGVAGMGVEAVLGAVPGNDCDGPAMDVCLARLAQEGLGMLGSSRELIQTCGDENPPLDFLANPVWLPQSATRRALERGDASIGASLAWLAAVSGTFRSHALRVFVVTVSFAHSCLDGGDCMPRGEALSVLRESQAEYFRSMAAHLSQAAGTSNGASAWVARIGEPAQILARTAFSERHLDFAASVFSGLESMDPNEVLSVLHDLTMRLATASCEMLAQLLAHFNVAKLLAPTLITDALAVVGGRPELLPRFEFHSGACCRRYHVLSHLISGLAEASQQPWLRVVEVGVNNALTSEYLVSRFPSVQFDGVDPWIGAEDIHREAVGRMARFGDRARLWHLRSEEAAPRFELQSLDLVFIDGDHSHEAVLEDLRLWRPLVRPGGLLAGHDLFNPAFDGVLSALLSHLKALGPPGGLASATVNFGSDFVWWLEL
mmetsp:Transcript_174103/g.558234  ORF Transcript_174103/g.558234 Transcript_174103/m.558234 type:complete len:453 (-) Transcript_174103:8-1366(-)